LKLFVNAPGLLSTLPDYYQRPLPPLISEGELITPTPEAENGMLIAPACHGLGADYSYSISREWDAECSCLSWDWGKNIKG
jgi:hypothetical protein